MNQALTKVNGHRVSNEAASVIERVVVSGDLATLEPADRMTYYSEVCKSVGLNPFTRPFEYIELSGKLTLYARKDATDQLRSNNSVSIFKLEREHIKTDAGALYAVTAYARDAKGREDSAMGVVSLTKEDGSWEKNRNGRSYFKKNGKLIPLTGDDLANAMMKAETKAKRRVTLSICGLGWLDESELGSIASARTVAVDHATGQIIDENDGSADAANAAELVPDEPPGPPVATPEASAPSELEQRVEERLHKDAEKLEHWLKESTPQNYKERLQVAEKRTRKMWSGEGRAFLLDVIKKASAVFDGRHRRAELLWKETREVHAKGGDEAERTKRIDKVAEKHFAAIKRDKWPASWKEPLSKRWMQLVHELDNPNAPSVQDVHAVIQKLGPKLTIWGKEALLRKYEARNVDELYAEQIGSVLDTLNDVMQVVNLNKRGIKHAMREGYKAVSDLKTAQKRRIGWDNEIQKVFGNNDIAREQMERELERIHKERLTQLGITETKGAPQAALKL